MNCVCQKERSTLLLVFVLSTVFRVHPTHRRQQQQRQGLSEQLPWFEYSRTLRELSSLFRNCHCCCCDCHRLECWIPVIVCDFHSKRLYCSHFVSMLTLAKTLDRVVTKMQQVEERRNTLDLFDEVDCYLRHVAEQKRLCNEKDSTANHSSLRLIMLVLTLMLVSNVEKGWIVCLIRYLQTRIPRVWVTCIPPLHSHFVGIVIPFHLVY